MVSAHDGKKRGKGSLKSSLSWLKTKQNPWPGKMTGTNKKSKMARVVGNITELLNFFLV